MRINQEVKTGLNQSSSPSDSAIGWHAVIADAERDIERFKARIKRLEGVIRTCQRKQAQGEPFPIE
jgi:hypothetical protein